MVDGLSHIEVDKNICEGCLLGKQHRESFPDSSYRAKGPLQLVYTDLYGPMDVPPLAGAKYFITFVDDYTRKT